MSSEGESEGKSVWQIILEIAGGEKRCATTLTKISEAFGKTKNRSLQCLRYYERRGWIKVDVRETGVVEITILKSD